MFDFASTRSGTRQVDVRSVISCVNECKTREELRTIASLMIARKFEALRHRIIFFDEERTISENMQSSKSELIQFLFKNHSPVHEKMLMPEQAWRSKNLRYDHGHAMAGPIVGNGEIVGLVALTREQGSNPFTDADARDLGAICAHLSTWKESIPLVRALTTRENQLAHLVADGLTNREIALELGVSENGIKQSLKRIFKKLRVRSRTEIAAHLNSRS